MSNEDEIYRAEQEFEKATAVIRKCLPGKPGFGNEAKYASAYAWLVRLGVRPRLRLKYRRS